MNQTESNIVDELAPSLVEPDNMDCDHELDSEENSSFSDFHPQNTGLTDNIDDQELQALIAGILKQDQRAFSALFKVMSARVLSLALRITGNIQLAEEVTEDTFFQIWRQAPRFDPTRGTAKTWILTIARSRALDARRKVQPFASEPDFETDVENNSQHPDNPCDLLSAVEENQMLYSVINALEPIPRQLITLAFFKGLSHEEIAIHVQLPLGTVKSHLRRAIVKLREALIITPNSPVQKP